MALKGFLGILVILPEMRGGWRFQFGFLGGVLHAERRPFTWRNLLFLRRNFMELLLESLDRGVSNEVVPFGGRSWEDVSLEFEGVASVAAGWRIGLGLFVFLFKKCKHRSVM